MFRERAFYQGPFAINGGLHPRQIKRPVSLNGADDLLSSRRLWLE